ncbi:hypothetical protein PINS_up015533 [Pythium insidiosum]|nr:hypothetical protein PINS_up015533 [Pythium insidiosum]
MCSRRSAAASIPRSRTRSSCVRKGSSTASGLKRRARGISQSWTHRRISRLRASLPWATRKLWTPFVRPRRRSARGRRRLRMRALCCSRSGMTRSASTPTISRSSRPPSAANRWPKPRAKVAYAAGFIDFYAHEIMHSAGFMVPTSVRGMQMMAVKEPVGVCGIITPWNFPLAMITRKLGPLLAAGCTAVVKPAAETPLSALALAKLAQDVGIPSGVINVVPASVEKAAEIGETLSTHPDVRKLSFTGSTRVGKLLMQQSASTVKRLSLELGGNAPFIVFEDADVAAAVDGLIASKFRNTGQTCVCSNRVFIHESVMKPFTAALVERVQKLKLGPPRAPGVQLGPLISPAAFQKTRALVADALSHGAKALVGGNPAPQLGANYFEPTVLVDVNDSMRIAHEEIFGPVVPLFTFRDEDDVVTRANGTDAGLAGYFYSRDLSRVWRVAAALEVGMVGVNTGTISNVQAPFGGVKQSGLGREGSFVGLDEYVETKLICMGGLE